jgi:hypothetical protein
MIESQSDIDNHSHLWDNPPCGFDPAGFNDRLRLQ